MRETIFFDFNHPSAGFAAILATVIILAVVLAVVGSLSLLILTEQKITKNAVQSAQAYYAAESGVEDSIYRVIRGKNYQATNVLTVASSTAAISISGDSLKTIRVNGQQNNRWRNLQVILNVNQDAISFYYAVQIGEGGLVMNNGSQVEGSIYSNGSVQGSAGAVVSGDALVASNQPLLNQQSVNVDSDFIFGRQGSDQIDAAQSFVLSASGQLTSVNLYLKKAGSPTNKIVRILTDDSGHPAKNLVSAGAYGTLNSSQLSQSSYGWIEVVITTPPTLTAGTRYWMMVDTSADPDDYFLWGRDSTDAYAPGTGQYSPNWNASWPAWYSAGGDLAFKVWLGGTENYLDTVSVGGNARSHTISDCSVGGDAYYQHISHTTVDGTSYPGSPDLPIGQMPISASNIADWKNEAAAGGTLDSFTLVNGAVASLGPKKITGDLTLFNNADLTITGTVYVGGNINISNGVKLRLGANYGNSSGVVLTDGAISVSNNSIFYTNAPGSYIMMLSTKTGSAININNNTNTVIFYASAGTVSIANNATVKEVTAYQITLSNNAQIIYESGLASAKFFSGSGATWQVSDWQEVP